MRTPYAPSYQYRPSLRSRATALLLSLAICALIVFTLIRMGMLAPGGGEAGERLTAIALRPQSAEQKHQRTERKAVQSHARAAVTQHEVTQPAPPKAEPVPELHLLKLSREEFAAADISKMPKRSAESSETSKSSQGGGAGASSGAAYGPGEGPGGARLYNAQWYREPTHAELAGYMPHRDVSGGWAMIACKTQEKYRVDDCQELGESPPGSGLARALRLAAWQFLVRPPTIDGRPQIGAWVRIRFDFTPAKSSGGADPSGG